MKNLFNSLEDKSAGFLVGYSYGFAFAVVMYAGLAVIYSLMGTDVQ